MTKKTSKVTNEKGDVVGGINQQIIGRVRRKCFNQYHPLWMNRRVFTATAESLQHPAANRYKKFLQLVNSGDPHYGVFSASFKDFSNIRTESDIRIEDTKDAEGRITGRHLTSTFGKPFKEEVPDWATIKDLKNQLTTAHFKREGLGIWARETRGWYAEEMLDRCIQAGIQAKTEPEIGRSAIYPDAHYFMGIDPAPALSKKADDGAMAIGRARPRPGLGAPPTDHVGDWIFEFVWGRRVRGETRRALSDEVLIAQNAREWSGIIHTKHMHFGLTGILMDKGGGADWIYPEMNKRKQIIDGIETECTPIATVDDLTQGMAALILNLLRRRDKGVESLWPLLKGDDNLAEAIHVVFQQAVEHAGILLPLPFNDRPGSETEGWEPERRWGLICLDEGRRQLMNIQAAVNEDGTWALTNNTAKQFAAHGKKDIAYAMIMAYVRFLIWLKMGDFEVEDEDEVGAYGI